MEAPQRKIYFKEGKVLYLPDDNFEREELSQFKSLITHEKQESLKSFTDFDLLEAY